MPRPDAPAPPPDEAALREAALRYLARYSATQAGLLRVLTRRVDRWMRHAEAPAEQVEAQAAAAIQAARAVVARLAAAGAVDDAVFAEGRARSLHRAGHSSRAISAHLRARGVAPDAAAQPDDPAHELAAAIRYIHRRRMGPFRSPPDPAQRMRDLARLARAGFPAETARQALDMPLPHAETMLRAARLT